ncbi:MAG: HNH endonuclease, partial [Pedococcus sp.]
LSTVTSTSRASHYRVYLHLSTDGAWVNGGGAIPRRLLDRFVSDGVVQPVWETEGRPVSVGRTMRILPARSRRLIHDRDRGCRFPGCTTTRFVEIHHLHEWAQGGPTDHDNQVSLCPFHHDAIDRVDYHLTGDPTKPDGLHVTNRHGLPIRPPTPTELTPPPDTQPLGTAPPGATTPGAARPGPGHHIDHAAYQPPTGERARWADIEIPPDRDLPPRSHLHAVPTS